MPIAGATLNDAHEAMDRIYRFQRHVYDVTRFGYLLGRDRLIAGLDVPDGGRVLEVGCGTGRNMIRAAERYRDSRFYGIDVSRVMLDTARGKIMRARLGSRLICAEADATGFHSVGLFGIEHFDRVFVSYALSMIPDWPAVLQRAMDATAPDGSLHIVDFGDFADMPAPLRALQLAWLRRFHVYPVSHLAERLHEVAAARGLSCSSERLYGGYAILAVLQRSASGS